MKRSARRAIPSTDSLVIFDACVMSMNFTLAGNTLGLTQSAVSRQILDLEQFLNVALFERAGRHLTLTGPGKQYWQQIKPLLDELEAKTIRMQMRHTLQNSLNLSVAASFCNRWLIPNLPHFLEQNPRVLVNVTSRVGPINLSMTEFDAAVINAPSPPPQGIVSKLLFPLRLAAFASPKLTGRKRQFSAQEIAALPLLHITGLPDGWRAYLEIMGLHDANISAGPHYSLWLLSCEAALAGLGVALLPPELVAEDVRAGRLLRLSPIELPRNLSYWLTWRETEDDSPALQAFRDWLDRRCLAV
jgi:DNA-binding transcriptional LysR family regulator